MLFYKHEFADLQQASVSNFTCEEQVVRGQYMSSKFSVFFKKYEKFDFCIYTISQDLQKTCLYKAQCLA